MKLRKTAVLAAILAAGISSQALAVEATPTPVAAFEWEMLGLGSNDTIGTAQDLGTVGLGDNINVFGARLSSGPGGTSVDYFKFVTSQVLDLSFAVNAPYGITEANDPIVGLFGSNGVKISEDDDSNAGYDSLLTAQGLAAGTYYVAVSGFSNFDFTGNGGNGNWYYNLNVTTGTPSIVLSAPVPEPESYAMLLAGLGIIGAVARRRKAA